jgi:hypothetical protein
MHEEKAEILTLSEIKNGYLLNMTDQYGKSPHLESFQWSATNDQRKDMIQKIINRLGMKHDLSLVERR